MFSNVALNVFIGLVFVFLLYSLLVTIVQEWIAVTIGFRARVLEKAILRMLEDGKTTTWVPFWDRISGLLHVLGFKNILKGKNVAPWFYAHPLIKYLGEDNFYSKPASLEATDFSKVMIDLLKGFGHPESEFVKTLNDSIHAGTIYKLPINLVAENGNPVPDKSNPAIKILQTQNKDVTDNDSLKLQTVQINRNTSLYLKSLWQEAGADPLLFRQLLERWFDETMKRATGWYKRYTRFILFLLGLTLAYAFNVDTIALHRILSRDPKLTEQLVEMAVRTSKDYSGEVEQIRKNQLPQDTGLLRSTYDRVLNDVQLSNNILGFGKPWKDSCKICNDSIGPDNCGFQRAMSDLQNQLASLSILLDSTRRTDTLASDSLMLLENQDALVKNKMQHLQQLAARCAYIRDQMSKTYFKYSPYQSGGFETFFGWLITALAITLGAPFWFDILNKLVQVKNVSSKIVTAAGENNSSSVTNRTPVNITVRRESDDDAVG